LLPVICNGFGLPVAESVLLISTDVTQPEHTLFNLIPGFPLNIAVCSRFAADVVSDWVYVQVLPKP
jgi:hypothetical protein